MFQPARIPFTILVDDKIRFEPETEKIGILIRSLPYSLSDCEPIRGRLSPNSGFAHFLSFQEKSSMVSRSLPIAVSTFQVDEIILKKSRSDSLFCQISYILQFGHHYDRLF